MIFSNLTFLDRKQSGVQLVLGISASSVSRLEDHSSPSESGVKRYSTKPRSFSNEVSINNAKSPFPGQLAESFPLRNISIYLRPCSSTNLQNWIIFHDRRFLYRFYRCVYSLEALKTVSDVLEQYDVVITFTLASLSKENKFKWSFPKNFQTLCFVFENYTSHWIIPVFVR